MNSDLETMVAYDMEKEGLDWLNPADVDLFWRSRLG